MICPDCNGKKVLTALVDGTDYRGPVATRCSLCNGTGEVDPQAERWRAIGGTHRTWRVARHESARECARRLGIGIAELCDMENGRTDPSPLIADTPEGLR